MKLPQHIRKANKMNNAAILARPMFRGKPERFLVGIDRNGNALLAGALDSTVRVVRNGSLRETHTPIGSKTRKHYMSKKQVSVADINQVRSGTTNERTLLIPDKETGELRRCKIKSKPVYRPIGLHDFKPLDGGK